ncbi:hypothetical protein KCU81_g5990, partial [Aureobasidium melanogenum]
MAAPQRPEQGHSRNQSDARRVAMPRRSTKGPLDVDTPTIPTFQPPTPALQTALPPSPAPTSMPVRTASPASSLLSPVQQNPASTSHPSFVLLCMRQYRQPTSPLPFSTPQINHLQTQIYKPCFPIEDSSTPQTKPPIS